MHIGIIADGNRRWAKEKGKTASQGHAAGINNAKELIKKAKELGIKYLTFYFFSSENMKKRPETEKKFLFKKLKTEIKKMADRKEVEEEKMRISVFGRTELLPKEVQESIEYATKKTKKNNKYFLNLCIVYDGRDEIVDAVKKIIKKRIDPKKIDRQTIKNNLYTKDMPPADLIIRTGMKNEKRLSGFLLWDSAYSEFYFTPTFFPEFGPKKLEKAINDLKKRHRRYGA